MDSDIIIHRQLEQKQSPFQGLFLLQPIVYYCYFHNSTLIDVNLYARNLAIESKEIHIESLNMAFLKQISDNPPQIWPDRDPHHCSDWAAGQQDAVPS